MNLIIGAGLAGLSTAYHFKNNNYIIFEKDDKVGGLCKSIQKEGFTFDYTGHLLHIQNDYTLKLAKKLLNNNLFKQKRKSAILFDNKIIPYPFQLNLYNLSAIQKKECIMGAIKAKYEYDIKPSTFKEWILKSLGTGIAKYFMFPYNEKLWGITTDKITTEWISGFVPEPNLEEIIEGALTEKIEEIGYNAEFWYPTNGGIEKLPLAFANHVNNINLNTEVKRINISKNSLITAYGEEFKYNNLVSSMPLTGLINIIDDIPEEIINASKDLKANSVIGVCLGVDRPNISDKHWLYVPEKDKIFYRIGFPSNLSDKMAPRGTSSICAEISYLGKMKFTKEELIQKVINDLIKCNILKKDDKILFKDVLELKYAYVIYDKNRTKNFNKIKNYLESNNIYLVGRYGLWEYSTMEQAILQGKSIAERIDNSGNRINR